MKRSQKIITSETLQTLRAQFKDKKIVHCHGVFDVLHAGHLAYFESAKKFGDILVVTLTSDEFVNKGPGRPYFNAAIRASMIAALEVVDFVGVNKHPTAVPMIELIKPHFYVKGPDYKNKALDITGAIFEEEDAVVKSGGSLVFTEDDIYSSSSLINKFFNQWSEDQNKVITQVKALGGFEEIEKILDRVAKESINVVGEAIVDTYVFCNPESISSKSPSVSARFSYEENYAGGALAIANHLADFVKDLTLITSHGSEPYIKDILKTKLDSRIRVFAQELPSVPTPRKTRFIANDKSQRIFEITHLRSDQWLYHSPEEFCATLVKNDAKDKVNILADFGHGLFEAKVLEQLSSLQGFCCLNVQTNSSNFGFNPFTKHKIFNFLSLDIREAQIAYHDRQSSPQALAKKIQKDLKQKNAHFVMTRRPLGSAYYPYYAEDEITAPAFADNVIDATGAGDAFFAITSLLVKVGCPDVLVPFIGNVFAGLKTKIIGNKSSVTRAQLLKALSAILK